ncbi:DUF294 nucleotidyltransferase-like domain-containing protein [Flavobacterium sp. '19STA2R22 D10 B1']|uniref:DUF294 nucleotidyltransferase-like domain-containing protein n=1 Tax=Flavobacterium aerium TaxID=3037261 RepID=UPI00278C3464|nr:DUF294 nucleotidyltransferase-like domain-containing protein [Flavobacterium sp. '19STA2R22 D10 B1']
MKNSIAERIADFIKNFPPFSSLNYTDLLKIAIEVRVIYLEKNKTLFQINDPCHDSFYIVKDGAIGLSVTSDAEETLIDKCDEGDILGLRPFFAKDNYLMTAKAREETIVYAIPIVAFNPFVETNKDVLSFLLESFASNTRNPYDKENRGKLISGNILFDDKQSEIQNFQSIKYSKNPITALPNAIVKDIAQLMTQYKIDSILIQNNDFPIGIVTDKDLRTKIATGMIPITAEVQKIMTSPVITVPENISVAEAQLQMLKNEVSHLCVTSDGSPKSIIKGIITDNDVIVAQANNPGVLIKEIKRALWSKDLKRIREKLSEFNLSSIQKNIPLSHITNITNEINSAITKQAIDLAIEKLGPPPTLFTWLTFGSQAREEQILLTDQDNALVFDDVDEENYDDVKDYFLRLAEKVTRTLEKVGYEISPDNMVASNPMWCKSLTDWKKQFNVWINTPGEKGALASSTFFDFEYTYGDTALMNQLSESIFLNMENKQKFYAYLANVALKNPPPLGFFRQFLVETDGEHKDTFDIKLRALTPLIDAARILIISHGVKGINNTYLRLKQLAILEPQHADLFQECADAFIILSKFRTLEGFKNNDSGRYLNLNELSKTDKVKLKNCFQPIHDIQELVKHRFQLTYFT